ELGAASMDVALPVDAGPHVIEVTARDRQPATFRVVAREGAETPVSVRAGEALAEDEPPAPHRSPEEGPAAPRSPVDDHIVAGAPARPEAQGGTSGLKIGGGIGLGLGIALLVAGVATGAGAISSKNTVDKECDPMTHGCTSSGASAASDGH